MDNVLAWLRQVCAGFEFQASAIFQRTGLERWPLTANSADTLSEQLAERGHLLPLPKEPAALANIIEVAVSKFVVDRLADTLDISVRQGSERGYPDLEIAGERFGGLLYALDIKVARRNLLKTGQPNGQTQSRITLYTGNTYFRYPSHHWPGTLRAFDEYAGHVALLVVYTLDEKMSSRARDLNVIVHETWRIASRQRSSTTREYIGAVMSETKLTEGQGEFATIDEFYRYWRSHKFKIGAAVQHTLDRLLREKRRPE